MSRRTPFPFRFLLLSSLACPVAAQADNPAAGTAPASTGSAGRVFFCEGGQRVQVDGNGAQVHLSDGRVLTIAPAATDAFRTRDASFVITADRASLTQSGLHTGCAQADSST